MAVRNRLGYNWKARQRSSKKAGNSFSLEAVPKVELDTDPDPTDNYPDDTNLLVLPGTKRVSSGADEGSIPKRKKLSSKQRKRLLKIVDSKERKAKVSVLNNAHSTWSLYFYL